MNHYSSHSRSALLFTLALTAVSLLAPARAEAQFRLSALVGMEHLGNSAPRVPSLVATGRLEATVGVLPWIHLGAYLGMQSDFAGPSGASYGAIAALRPHFPLSPVDPFAFASLGWMQFPTGNSTLTSGWDGQVGAGLTLHATEILDVEARLAYVGMLSRSDNGSALGGSGYAASTGIALHF